jgi:hypothetical protein
MMRRSGSVWCNCALAATAAVALSAGVAHAQVGRRNFITPLITEDPNPDNELDLLPGWSRGSNGSDASFTIDLQKTLSENTSIELDQPINDPSRRRLHSTTGLDNLGMELTWAFFKSDEHETRLGIAADVFFPTGEIESGADGHTRAGPLFSLAKGMGDLPDTAALNYLRPFAIQADAAYLPTWSGHESVILQSDAALSYDFSYLAGSGVRVPWPINGLVPFVEFNYQQVVQGRPASTPPDFRITPALAYVTGPYQFTLGSQWPLNATAGQNNQAGIIALLDIELDKIFPAVGWTQF